MVWASVSLTSLVLFWSRRRHCSVEMVLLYIFVFKTFYFDLGCMCALSQSCPTLCGPMDYIAHQALLSMGFSGQEYWSGLPFSSPGVLLDPGTEPRSPEL